MKTLFVMTLLALSAWAQEKKEQPPEPRVSRLIQLKYLSGADLSHAIDMMRMFGVNISGDSTMRAIAVSGSKEGVAAVEEAMKRLDVPPSTTVFKNIEVTLHVILGSHKAGETKLIPDVEPVIKQMRGLFQFQSYQMLDTMLIRSREDKPFQRSVARFGGRISLSDSSMVTCSGQLSAGTSEEGKSRSYRLDGFMFQCDGPARIDIRTDLDVKEGQKAVVGKSNIDANSAIFLIVSAKQVD